MRVLSLSLVTQRRTSGGRGVYDFGRHLVIERGPQRSHVGQQLVRHPAVKTQRATLTDSLSLLI